MTAAERGLLIFIAERMAWIDETVRQDLYNQIALVRNEAAAAMGDAMRQSEEK